MTVQSYDRIGHGKREIFFLNLEDGYFGCQVNDSTDILQLFELSKLCDGRQNCFMGSDELRHELKCTDNCQKEDGSRCQNGACLDGQCHCNDGYGGCNCEVPDENECKYRPCDVFAHCTNTLGSFSCTCYPGYQGDGFHCEGKYKTYLICEMRKKTPKIKKFGMNKLLNQRKSIKNVLLFHI
ncbi:hypothetical protein WA026_022529 [Henosepilachna vigintioctopunctata]|uniref:EGF-like domain-containing protein n=1 Tax=Henosepilachna vigintioctopunctata TaxID=420089 RepID=A0AAW1URS2_9CUCU